MQLKRGRTAPIPAGDNVDVRPAVSGDIDIYNMEDGFLTGNSDSPEQDELDSDADVGWGPGDFSDEEDVSCNLLTCEEGTGANRKHIIGVTQTQKFNWCPCMRWRILTVGKKVRQIRDPSWIATSARGVWKGESEETMADSSRRM